MQLPKPSPAARQCTRPGGTEWRCGQKAALALADWIGAQPVSGETEKKDKYRRWLAAAQWEGRTLEPGWPRELGRYRSGSVGAK